MCDTCERTMTRRSVLSRVAAGLAAAGATPLLGIDSASASAPQSRLPQAVSAPSIVSRRRWGATESIRVNDRFYAPIRKLIVHHSASPNKPSSPANVVRSMEAYHILTKGYTDIGYNYLIDHKGVIYEGRAARNYGDGDTITAEDSNGWGVVGGHAKGYNAGAVGICLIGNFENTDPTDAALGALSSLMAWKASKHKINALASETYYTIYGGQKKTANIAGHTAVGGTQCPGAQLLDMLPWIREEVGNRAGAWPDQAINMGDAMRYEGGALRGQGSPNSSSSSSSGTPTTAAPTTTTTTTTTTAPKQTSGGSAAATGIKGYRVVSEGGRVFTAGKGAEHGNPSSAGASKIVGLANGKAGDGYWALDADGTVYAYGSRPALDSVTDDSPAVDIAATYSGQGYVVLVKNGGIYRFGDALHHGSPKRLGVAANAKRIAVRPQGDGYWVLSDDNVIRAFGNANGYGSPGGTVVDLWSTPSGKGYWALTSNGAIGAFGDAIDKGDIPRSGKTWSRQASHIIGTPTGNGYVICNSEGSIRSFGDAPSFPSFAGSGITATGICIAFA